MVELGDGCGEGIGVLRFDRETGAGIFKDLPCLTFHTQNHGARARHIFEHFSRNDRLEHIGFLQQDEANVGSRYKRRDLLARLLIEKPYISQPSGVCERFDAFFFRAFSDENEKYIGGCGLKSGRGIEHCFQAVGDPIRRLRCSRRGIEAG